MFDFHSPRSWIVEKKNCLLPNVDENQLPVKDKINEKNFEIS